MWPIVRRINDLEPKLAGLSDASLQEKTFEFKNRLANGETLDDIPVPKPLPSSAKLRAV